MVNEDLLSRGPAAVPPMLAPVRSSFPLDLVKAQSLSTRWAPWRAVWNPKRGKWDKIPLYPSARGGFVSTQARWWSFDVAWGSYEIRDLVGDAHGVGLNLTKLSGFVALDLDGCVGPDGTIAPWARAIVERAASYTELSPSGTGLRILLRARLPEDWTNHERGIECYGGSSARFVTLTGRRLEGAPTAVARAPDGFLDALREEHKGTARAPAATNKAPPADMPELVAEADLPELPALRDRLPDDVVRFLLEGEVPEHADGSRVLLRATVKLLEVTAGPDGTLDDAVVLSMLVANPFAMGVALRHRRDDADRALEYLWTHHVLKGRKLASPVVFDELLEPEGEAPTARNFLTRIRDWTPKTDAGALLAISPVEWLVVDWIQAGLAGALVAEGGTGKTTLLILLGLSIATGRPFLGLEIGRTGTFVLLSLDDSQDDLDATLAEVVRAEALSTEELDAVRTRVRVISLRGADGVEGFARVERGAAVPTKVEDRIAAALEGVPDLQCVALDTLRMFSGSGSTDENAMTIATRAMTTIAERLGCVTITSHHTGKGQSRDGVDDQYIGAGSSAIGDNLRFVLRLRPATDDEIGERLAVSTMPSGTRLRLSSQRGSLRVKAPVPLFFARDGFALRPVVGRFKPKDERDEERVQAAVEAIDDGVRSATALQARMGVRKATALALVDQLMARGLVEREGGRAGGRLLLTAKGSEMVGLA